MHRLLLFLAIASSGCHSLPAGNAQVAPLDDAEARLRPAKRAPRPEVHRTACQFHKEAVDDENQSHVCRAEYLEPAISNRQHLQRAAAALTRGDDDIACLHLGEYVAAHPDRVRARAHYAELLWRAGRLDEARAQFLCFDTLAQEDQERWQSQRIHAQCRLVRIAVERQDEYAEHLHRGIGLYLLARERRAHPQEEGPSAESLYCQSARELKRAQEARPDEARPAWYLYEVWSQLAQRQPALKSLHTAIEAAALSKLSPTERRDLELARLNAMRPF